MSLYERFIKPGGDKGDTVSSLLFTEGKPAKIAAYVDKVVTKVNVFIGKRTGMSETSKPYGISTGRWRFEIHPRFAGRQIITERADSVVEEMNEASIVHVYLKGIDDREKMLDRSRLKDNPIGFHKNPRI